MAGYEIRLADAGEQWGWFAIAASAQGVCGATFGHANSMEAGKELEERLEQLTHANSHGADQIAAVAADELLAFFAGDSLAFSVPVALAGTAFQQAVWHETNAIAYGELATYQEIAKRIGRPQAYRAVGNALGKNALPVIVPCHRVIASDGTFGGYTRGLPWKERLLALEGSLSRLQIG
jgi:methylated-DNA-[protein]-cysteine S-methyltransferase